MKIITSIIGLLMIITLSHAQNKINIIDHSGQSTSFSLNAIDKITFPNDNMEIDFDDSSSSVFELEDLGEMKFSSIITSDDLPFLDPYDKLVLYPLPVLDDLYLIQPFSNVGIAKVDIYNSLGCVVFTTTVNNDSRIHLKVSFLDEGFYVMKFTSGDFIETQILIKE